MGTVSAPAPETPTAPAESPVAEPETVASPNPEPETPQGEPAPEGDSKPESEGDEREIPEDLNREKTVEWLAQERERIRAEERERADADADKRVQVRQKEADTGEAARLALYATAEREGEDAFRAIMASHAQGDPLPRTELEPLLAKLSQGIGAVTARDNEKTVANLLTHLPDMTPEEAVALEPLQYEFRRNGHLGELPAKVIELALARRDGELKEARSKAKDRAELKAAAETLANLSGTPPSVPAGSTPSGDLTYQQYLKLPEKDKATFNEKHPERFRAFIGISGS